MLFSGNLGNQFAASLLLKSFENALNVHSWPQGLCLVSDWKGKQGSPSQKPACLHRFFFEWGVLGLGRGLREIQRDSYYFSCQGENMRVVRLTNGRVSAAVESGKSLRRLADVTHSLRWTRPANGCEDLAPISRYAGIHSSARPCVSCAGEGQQNTRGADVRAGSGSLHLSWHSGSGCSSVRSCAKGKKGKRKEKKRKKPGTRSSSVFQESESQTLGFSRAHHAKWMTSKYSLMGSCVNNNNFGSEILTHNKSLKKGAHGFVVIFALNKSFICERDQSEWWVCVMGGL